MSTQRTIIIGLLSLLIYSMALSAAAACPNCKESLAQDANSAWLVRGYGWSIIFMMSTPFLILASLGGYFYYEICKARKQMTASPSAAYAQVQGRLHEGASLEV